MADYSTYIGDADEYQVAKVITGATGNTYVTGEPLDSYRHELCKRRIVTKLDAAGNLLFTSTFGGKGLDQAGDMALDRAGNIYVVGHTSSPNFPLRHPLQAESGMQDVGFNVKLGADGGH